MQVMRAELGATFSDEAQAAFSRFLTFIRDAIVSSTGESRLSDDDKSVIGDIVNIISLNRNFGLRLLTKYVLATVYAFICSCFVCFYPRHSNNDTI